MHRTLLLFAWLVGFALVPASAWQKDPKPNEPYALIFGTVLGPDKRPVQGGKIKIRLADKKKTRWEHFSDRRGEFARRVPPGPADYLVWAEVRGSQSTENNGVKVHVEGEERRDIILH